MRKLFTVLLVSTLLIVGIQKEEATSVSVAKPTITATPTHSGTEQRTRLDRYYDIPLSRGMQRYTRQESTQREIPYELVLAVMQVESNFDSDLISKTNDYGLMQINKCNHKSLQKVFGKESFLNPQFNVKCGTYLLSTLYDKYHGNIHKTLMAYNMGEGGMNRLWKKGIHSSKYSRKVVKIYETYTRTK